MTSHEVIPFPIERRGVSQDFVNTLPVPKEPQDDTVEVLERRFSAIGQQTTAALNATMDIAGPDAAQIVGDVHHDINEFIATLCDNADPEIIANHLPLIREGIYGILVVHRSSILSSAEPYSR